MFMVELDPPSLDVSQLDSAGLLPLQPRLSEEATPPLAELQTNSALHIRTKVVHSWLSGLGFSLLLPTLGKYVCRGWVRCLPL